MSFSNQLSQLKHYLATTPHKARKPLFYMRKASKHISKPLIEKPIKKINSYCLHTQIAQKIYIRMHKRHTFDAILNQHAQHLANLTTPTNITVTSNAKLDTSYSYYQPNQIQVEDQHASLYKDYRYKQYKHFTYTNENDRLSNSIQYFANENEKPPKCSNLKQLLAYFFNSADDAYIRKQLLKYNPSIDKNNNIQLLNAKQILELFSTSKQYACIEDINSITNDIALNLAKKQQRLLVFNGVEFFTLIPCLEYEKITKRAYVSWSWVRQYSTNANANISCTYHDLDKSQKKNYIKNVLQNYIDKDFDELTQCIEQKKIDAYQPTMNVEKNNAFKKDLINAKIKHSLYSKIIIQKSYISDKLSQVFACTDLNSDDFNDTIKACVKELRKDMYKYLINNDFKISKKNALHIKKIIQSILSKLANNFTTEFKHNIQNKTRLNIQDILSAIQIPIINTDNEGNKGNKNDENLHPLHIISSADIEYNNKKNIINTSLADIAAVKSTYNNIDKTSSNNINYTSNSDVNDNNDANVDGTENIHLENESNESLHTSGTYAHQSNVLQAFASLYGLSAQEFIQKYPSISVSNLEDISTKHALKYFTRQLPDVMTDRYDLNAIFKHAHISDSKLRKNGKSLIDGPIKKAIEQKQNMILESSAKLCLNKKSDLFWIKYVAEKGWCLAKVTGEFGSEIFFKPIKYQAPRNDLSKPQTEIKIKSKEVPDGSDKALENFLHHNVQINRAGEKRQADLYLQRNPYVHATYNEDVYRCDYQKNISHVGLHLSDKLSQHKTPWDEARIKRAYQAMARGRDLVAKEMKYKQSTHWSKRYIDNCNYWSSRRTRLRALQETFVQLVFDGKDPGRRFWGNFFAGATQPCDAFGRLVLMGGLGILGQELHSENLANFAKHAGVNASAFIMGDVFWQCVADAVQAIAYQSKPSYSHIFNKACERNTHDVRRDFIIVNGQLHALIKWKKSIQDSHESIFDIDGLKLNKKQALACLEQKHMQSLAPIIDLISEDDAKNRILKAMCITDQLRRSLFTRIPKFFAVLFTGAPAAKALVNFFGHLPQIPLAGLENHWRQKKVGRAVMFHCEHFMTEQALENGLQYSLYENNSKKVRDILIRDKKTYYSKNEFNKLLTKEKDAIVGEYLCDVRKVQELGVSHNVERRIGLAENYIASQKATLETKRLKYQCALLKLAETEFNLLNIKEQKKYTYIEHKLKKLLAQKKAFTEMIQLFYDGLAVHESKQKDNPDYVYTQQYTAWAKLVHLYPNSQLTRLMSVNVSAAIAQEFKNLCEDPYFILEHALVRTSFWPYLAIDEVQKLVFNKVEHSEGTMEAKAVTAGIISTSVAITLTPGVGEFFDKVYSNGRPENHPTYCRAIRWKINKRSDYIHAKLQAYQNKKDAIENIERNANDNKNANQTQKNNKKIESIEAKKAVLQQELEELKYYDAWLESELEPQKGLTNITRSILHKPNIEHIQEEINTWLVKSFASFIPARNDSKLQNILNRFSLSQNVKAHSIKRFNLKRMYEAYSWLYPVQQSIESKIKPIVQSSIKPAISTFKRTFKNNNTPSVQSEDSLLLNDEQDNENIKSIKPVKPQKTITCINEKLQSIIDYHQVEKKSIADILESLYAGIPNDHTLSINYTMQRVQFMQRVAELLQYTETELANVNRIKKIDSNQNIENRNIDKNIMQLKSALENFYNAHKTDPNLPELEQEIILSSGQKVIRNLIITPRFSRQLRYGVGSNIGSGLLLAFKQLFLPLINPLDQRCIPIRVAKKAIGPLFTLGHIARKWSKQSMLSTQMNISIEPSYQNILNQNVKEYIKQKNYAEATRIHQNSLIKTKLRTPPKALIDQQAWQQYQTQKEHYVQAQKNERKRAKAIQTGNIKYLNNV